MSVIEVVDDAHGGTLPTSSSVAFTATPVAGDVLVVFVAAYHALTVSGMSGCGATWAQAHAANTTNFRQSHIVWIGTGATSAGTVTVTTNATSAGVIRGFMVRGLGSATVASAATTEVNGTTLNGPAHTAASGQFALAGAGSAGPGTMTFPSTETPSGWTTQTERSFGSGPYPFNTTHREPSSSATHQVAMTLSTTRQIRVTQVVIGSVSSAITVAGAVAGVTVGAHAGSGVSPINVPGSTANVTATAHSGSIPSDLNVAGATAGVTVTGWAGSTGGLDVAGSTANVTVEAIESQTNFYAATPDTFTRGNGRTRVGICYATVAYDPTTPPRPQRPVGIMAQQLPEPTLVDGKPT